LSRTKSLVWLKCLNLFCNVHGEPGQRLSKVSSVLAARDTLEDREANQLGIFLLGRREREVPCKLVKSGTETIEKLAQEHPHDRVDGFELRPADIPRILSILPCDDGIRFLRKESQLPIERVEVYLRPFGFHYQIG